MFSTKYIYRIISTIWLEYLSQISAETTKHYTYSNRCINDEHGSELRLHVGQHKILDFVAHFEIVFMWKFIQFPCKFIRIEVIMCQRNWLFSLLEPLFWLRYQNHARIQSIVHIQHYTGTVVHIKFISNKLNSSNRISIMHDCIRILSPNVFTIRAPSILFIWCV